MRISDLSSDVCSSDLNHVVFDGFDVRGGTLSCVFSEAHDVTVRDAIIRDCPSHGILGADNNSGPFTLEYSEIFTSGDGTRWNSTYRPTAEAAYPGSVIRMQYNSLRTPTGRVRVRLRQPRATTTVRRRDGHQGGGT